MGDMMGLPEGWEGSYEALAGSLKRRGRVNVQRVGERPIKIKARGEVLPLIDFEDDRLVPVTIYLKPGMVMAMSELNEGAYEQAVTDLLLKKGKTWWVTRWFTALNLEK